MFQKELVKDSLQEQSFVQEVLLSLLTNLEEPPVTQRLKTLFSDYIEIYLPHF